MRRRPGSATRPRSPSSTSATDAPAPTSAASESAKLVSSHDPTSDTTTVPTTKTSRALSPARRAVRAVNCRRAMTATTSSATATTSPTASSTSRSSPASDTTRPIVGSTSSSTTKTHHADRSRRRRPTPSAKSTAAYTRLGTIGTVAIDTGSSLRSKNRFSGGTSQATRTTADSTKAKAASQSGHRSSRRLRPRGARGRSCPSWLGRTRLVGDRRHLSSSRGPVLKDSQAVRLFRRGTHLAARTRPSTAAASLPARKGPSP